MFCNKNIMEPKISLKFKYDNNPTTQRKNHKYYLSDIHLRIKILSKIKSPKLKLNLNSNYEINFVADSADADIFCLENFVLNKKFTEKIDNNHEWGEGSTDHLFECDYSFVPNKYKKELVKAINDFNDIDDNPYEIYIRNNNIWIKKLN